MPVAVGRRLVISRTFAALADPTRRVILARLARGEATLTELATPFDLSLPAVSRHPPFDLLLVLPEPAYAAMVGPAGGRAGLEVPRQRRAAVAEALQAWREAERVLASLRPTSADHAAVAHALEQARNVYLRLAEGDRETPEMDRAMSEALETLRRVRGHPESD